MHNLIYFWLTMAKTPMVLWLVGPLIMAVQRYDLFEKRVGSSLRYAKPMQQRIGFLVMAASFPWAAIYLRPLEWYWPMDTVLVMLALGVIYLSGPNEVKINLQSKTYTAKFGWPFRPKIWSGSFEDISKVEIIKNSADYSYGLILRWKVKRLGIYLGQFSSRDKAEAAGTKIIKSWGIEVPVEYARPGGQQTRSI